MKAVQVADFGRDHWTTLAYVETLCVDSAKKGVGEVDKRRMRVNRGRHPMHAVNHNLGSVGEWKSEFGTRLLGYLDAKGKPVAERQIKSHDDWDCLNDLEAAGFVEVISEANGFVRMTEKGLGVGAALRAYKAHRGMYSGFRWAEPVKVGGVA